MIAITGTGLVTAAGRGVDPLARALCRGETHLRYDEARAAPVARVDEFDLSWPAGARWLDARKYVGRAAHLAVNATELALAAVGGGDAAFDARRGGAIVVVDSDLSEWTLLDAILRGRDDGRPWARRIYEDLADFHKLRSIPSVAAQMVAWYAQLQGGITAVGSPCLGGLSGLSLACDWIASGEMDYVVLVGSTTLPPPELQVARDRVERTARSALPGAGPFDRGRDGTFLGEGAAALLLESSATAERRGAAVLGQVLACDTRISTTTTAALAAAIAATRATDPGDPDVVWAHGSGSRRGDRVEARVLADHLSAPTTASKGAIGNLPHCSALVDVVMAVHFLERRRLPPVCLHEHQDAALGDLCLVSGEPITVSGRVAAVVALDDPQDGAGLALIGRVGDRR